jgi:phosphate butyryltransferase
MKNQVMLHNVPWSQLQVGDSASIERVCDERDIHLFAHASGNLNPATLPLGRAIDSADAVAPSLWIAGLLSALIGTRLPGPGTLYRSQTLNFRRRVKVGDTLIATVTCVEKREAPVAIFQCAVATPQGETVADGLVEVDAPLEAISCAAAHLPELILDRHDHFAPLLAAARALPTLTTAVVCPEDAASLIGALSARNEALIEPVLIGDRTRIEAAAASSGVDLSGARLVEATDARSAAAAAVALAARGEVQAIMKGNLHTDILLAEVVRKETGLRTHRRISHVFAIDAPTMDHLLLISDAAINIAPDLTTKVDIVQNAIDLAHAIGIAQPRVSILSAIETINPAIPSTMDAAILAKMSERGQITGGIVDGPLAMDNAIDPGAAHTKGIASLVAGRADILIVPNLEAGNMLAKELIFVARAQSAGLVIGARVPIMLTSRADDDRARLASSALAVLYAGRGVQMRPHANGLG